MKEQFRNSIPVYPLLRKLLNITVSPWAPPHDGITCVDLKTVEELARRKHSDKFAREVTARILQDDSFFPSYRPRGWEITTHVPMPLACASHLIKKIDPSIIPRPPRSIYRSFSPLICVHCQNVTPSAGGKYEYIPYDIEFLREHVKEVHPQMLHLFEKGWAAYPESMKEVWNVEARARPFVHYQQPRWNSWGETTRDIWHAFIEGHERRLRDERVDWKFQFGGLKLYPLPDVESVIPREKVGRPDRLGDVPLLIEAFFMLRHYQAMQELRPRLWNEEERQKLLKEVVAGHEALRDVYVKSSSPEF